MKGPIDPVADVLLHFQSAMAQFLELQAGMMEAYRRRRPAVVPVPVPVPAPVRQASAPPIHQRSPIDQPAFAPRPTQIDQPGFSRYTLTVRERPLQARAGLAPGRVVVVTDDERGIAGLVAKRLRDDGRTVAIVASRAPSDRQQNVFVSPLDSPEDTGRLVRQIEMSCGPIGALMHLMPLSVAPPFEALDAASWWERLSHETRTLFLLAQALGTSLAQAARDGGAALMAMTSMGGSFGIRPGDPLSCPSQGGVVGFAKCLAAEWPDVRVRAVDLDASEGAAGLAAQVIDELWAIESAPEIGYSRGRRVAVEMVPAPSVFDGSPVLSSEAVLLATGGARGITAEVCLELAERYQPTFVIVGQSPLPPPTEPPHLAGVANVKRALIARMQAEGTRVTPAMVEKAYRRVLRERAIRDTIGKLAAAGARTHYVQCDVTDERAFAAVIADIYAAYGRLDGVIHGAGIIEDKLVQDKSLDSFDRVLRTKTMSTFTLSRHLRPESLRFLVVFSSVAGRFGNRGQADYAAGNEVVSKLASVLHRSWPGRVCSIAWAPWDQAGMVSPEMKREFARRGVELLSPAAGRQALWQEIQLPPSAGAEVVVGGPAAATVAPGGDRERLPLLEDVRREALPGGDVRFVRVLDPSVDLYLQDHRLEGRPVFPLAFATEFMAEAAQAAWPAHRVVAVRDLQLLKGIILDSRPLPVTATLRHVQQAATGDTIDVHVELSIAAPHPLPRYRAVVRLARHGAAAPPFQVPDRALVPLPKPLNRAYADWTFHGPLFQRVTRVSGLQANAIVGTVFSSSTVRVLANVRQPDWIIDPFVFDAALQLLLIWSRARNDKTALPSRFSSFTRYAPLSDEPLTCDVDVESLAEGHALRSTVHFVGADGRLLARLDDMEASCTVGLNRLTTAGREEAAS